jgi:class 3 adenylate cyclase
VSWAFFSACFFLSIYYFSIPSVTTPGMFDYTRLYLLANTFFPAAAVHMSLYFPNPRRILERMPLLPVVPYLVSAILTAQILRIYPDKGFVVYWNLVVLYMVIGAFSVLLPILLEFIRPTSVLARQRSRVVLFGAALAFPLPAIAYSSQALFGSFLGVHVHINFLGLPILLFPVSIAFAIVKHNLFDVDAYIKRTVGYILMTTILASSYLGLQSGVRYLIDPVFGEAAESIYPVLYAILVVFLFNPVNTRIQSFIDRLFYRKEYDFKEVVQGIENSLASVLDVNERMSRLVNTIKETLFLDTTGIVVYATDSGLAGNTYFEISSEDDTESLKTKNLRIAKNNPLADLVMQEGKMLTRFDVEEDAKYAVQRDSCLEEYDNLNATICTPLIHNDKPFGVLFLGNKKSGKFFNKLDIDLVRMLTARGAVAIDNAQLVEQMQKEEEVRSNLARYLSPQIVDRVVSDGVELDLGGQRKEVSVLFSDIRGFTTISETWPPDQLVKILNEYMTEMVAVVFENKGSIDKFVGDAIVAVFGSLIEVKNHAQHAVEGALGMLQRLPELNRKWQQEYGVGLNIGAGINTGEVFLGNIGSPDRMEFTVIGDAVNLAARLEGLTKFYGVELVVSEFTHGKLEDILCRKLDLVQVKGKQNAVAIYEPVCPGSDADDALRAELGTYDEALAAYYARQWDAATDAFGALCSEHPERKLYQLYQERIQDLRTAGLPEDWDGVFVHTSK